MSYIDYEGPGAEFMHFVQGESYVSPSETAWLAWVKKVEAILGHSLDGDNSDAAKMAGTADGYSLDEAYDLFSDGCSPEDAADEFQNANERAYDRQQERLMETGGGPTLREQQIAAMKLK